MRKLTLVLLSGAYLCLSLIVALAVWRGGGGWGAGVAALVASLGFAYALHALAQGAMDGAKQKRNLGRVREAYDVLLGQMEAIDQRLIEMAGAFADEAAARSEALTSEVHMLEDQVQQIGQRLEAQLSRQFAQARTSNPVGVGGRSGGRFDQSAALLETVREALAQNRVDLYLQPVVSLPQRRTVFYESFSRLRDDSGRVLMPAEYLAVAEPEGLIAAIDNLLLFRCVQIVRRLARSDRKIGIFCNISLASLSDEQFFPPFLEFLAENQDLADSVIFELGQTAFDQRGAIEARHMARLADLGFRFSIDKVVDLDLDFKDLSRADVRFVKVGANFLLEQLEENAGRLVISSLPDLQAADFSAMIRRYGLELIVEKVENERQVVDILELDIGFGQGHLFGEPRAIKDSVLAEAEPPSDFVRSKLQRRAGGWR